jgi:hypothetical protein
MAIHRLKPRFVDTVTKAGMYSDGAGLYLQVGEGGGAKSWIFRYSRRRFGKPGEAHMGLGSTHTFSLDEAREIARAYRQQIKQGIDPLESRKAERLTKKLEESKHVTFGFCAADYLKAKVKEGLRPNSIELLERMIRLYLNPVLKDVPVAAIDHQQMYQILDRVLAHKIRNSRQGPRICCSHLRPRDSASLSNRRQSRQLKGATWYPSWTTWSYA